MLKPFYIYRPLKYSTTFFDEFSVLLSIIVTDFDSIIINGDVIIHVYYPNDRNAQELSTMLENFGLLQHVKEPNHNKGHILDFVISKGLTISNFMVLDAVLLAHFCVLFNMTVIVDICNRSKTVKKHYLIKHSSMPFSQSISMTPTFVSIS